MVETLSGFLAAGAAELQRAAGVSVILRARSGGRVAATAVITVKTATLDVVEGGGQLREVGHALLPATVTVNAGDFLDELDASGVVVRSWWVAGAARSALGDGLRLELVRYE